MGPPPARASSVPPASRRSTTVTLHGLDFSPFGKNEEAVHKKNVDRFEKLQGELTMFAASYKKATGTKPSKSEFYGEWADKLQKYQALKDTLRQALNSRTFTPRAVQRPRGNMQQPESTFFSPNEVKWESLLRPNDHYGKERAHTRPPKTRNIVELDNRKAALVEEIKRRKNLIQEPKMQEWQYEKTPPVTVLNFIGEIPAPRSFDISAEDGNRLGPSTLPEKKRFYIRPFGRQTTDPLEMPPGHIPGVTSRCHCHFRLDNPVPIDPEQPRFRERGNIRTTYDYTYVKGKDKIVRKPGVNASGPDQGWIGRHMFIYK